MNYNLYFRKLFNLPYRCLLIAVAVFLFFGANNSIADESLTGMTVSKFADLYVDLAFGSEFQSWGPRQDSIFKRVDRRPVNIIPLPKPSVPLEVALTSVAAVAQNVEQHSANVVLNTHSMDELNELLSAGLSPEVLRDSVVIYIGTRSELGDSIRANADINPHLVQLFERAASDRSVEQICMAAAAPTHEGSNIIGMAIVWIEYKSNIDECIYEELMQSFGLGNDFSSGVPSMFNDDGVYSEPTDLDWLFWQVHTDPRMSPGMNRIEAHQIASQVAIELGAW